MVLALGNDRLATDSVGNLGVRLIVACRRASLAEIRESCEIPEEHEMPIRPLRRAKNHAQGLAWCFTPGARARSSRLPVRSSCTCCP